MSLAGVLVCREPPKEDSVALMLADLASGDHVVQGLLPKPLVVRDRRLRTAR